jgi:RND family efflux transporter MFP subunit
MDGNVHTDTDRTDESAKNGRGRLRGAVPAGAAVTALALGALLLGGCAGPDAQTAKAAPAVPPSVAVTDVKADTVRSTYSASGAVEATDQVPIIPKVGGRVQRLDAEMGASVAAGQLIAELDHPALDAQVAQAQAGLEAAQAKLAQLERGPRAEDVAGAAGQRDAAAQQAAAAAAQATAAAQGLSTLDAQVQAAQQQQAAAAAQASAARVRVEQLKNPRPEDLTLLQSQVNLAKIRLAQAQSRDEEIKVAAAQVETAKVGLQQAVDGNRPESIRAAQAALDQAETALSQISTMPVRAEDIEVARLAWEGADAAYRSAQDVLTDSTKAYNSAKQQSDNLPFLMTRAQADGQLAQAEAGVHNAQANLEARRVARDQARATYEKMSSGATEWDVRQAQERVEAAKAQLDLTKNPDPSRIKTAQLAVEQAQAQLDSRVKQIGFDLQTAEEGVHQAETQLAKVQQPGPLDVKALEDQAAAGEAQAAAAQAQVDALVSQRQGADSTTAAAGNQAAAAAATAKQAEAGYALRANPYTAEDLRAARAAVQQAQAALDGAKVQQAEAFIYAPVDGTIASRGASVGSTVGPNAPIVTLVSTSVEVTVPVEEARVASVQPGQTVSMTAAAAPGETLSGTVVAITPSADPRSRTFTARVRPDEAAMAKLKPGMFVEVSINTDEHAGVTVIPRQAVSLRDGKQSVFVVGPDNTLSLRTVKLGLTADRVAEVLDGVKIGERVVVLGQDDLRDGQQVAPAPAK